MTKVAELKNVVTQHPKPIEFFYFLVEGKIFNKMSTKPSAWDNILLLEKDYDSEYDLMFCYDNDGIESALVLGHFNSGIV